MADADAPVDEHGSETPTDGWQQVLHEESGRTYWSNPSTGARQWHSPHLTPLVPSQEHGQTAELCPTAECENYLLDNGSGAFKGCGGPFIVCSDCRRPFCEYHHPVNMSDGAG